MKDESKKVAKKEESSDESSADNKYEQPAKKAASAKKATPEHKNAVRKESSNEDSSEDEKPDKEATPARTAAPTMASTKEESSDDACGACGCSTPGSTPNKTKKQKKERKKGKKPYYPRTQQPLGPLQATTIGRGLPPPMRRNLRFARGIADSFRLRAHRYLHQAPPRPHIQPHTLTTPLHATTLHSHLLQAHTPAPHSYFCFGYNQPVPGALLVLVSAAAKDRATPHIHKPIPLTPANTQPPHPLAKYTKEPWL